MEQSKSMVDNLYTTNSIRTYTGIYVDFMNLQPEMFCIEDIASSLSFIVRFTGHAGCLLTVAQHSLEVCDIVPNNCKLTALLHDATEAYMNDLAGSVKHLFPKYVEKEKEMYAIIAQKFGLINPIPGIVRKADKLNLEYQWDNYILRHDIHPTPSKVVEQKFLNEFERLNNKNKFCS